ncbi:uncharacterized protein LOC120668554 isoform X1 [Panicum virgatum]|uniref:Uncharacterized protein n=1 Tax=Panicum virgatum TaxID=38727 RepID=A0A8T0THG2_PANVG|nr:uncharacterized protein LOC120668554 isoform X1 [Panicum virgatum]KAG2608116.1 hypothetical protein PVAP13_4NG285300 [Panicum virgatum]
MALRLLGSKLPQALPRHLVRGLPPLAKAAVTSVQEISAFGCPPRAKDLLPRANATYSLSSSSKGQAGSDSIFGRRNFSSGLPTENTQMSSSKKDPSAPGNVKPPAADGESDSSECVTLRSSCGLPIAASSGLTIYNTVEIYRYRSWWSKHMENISEY